MITEEFKSRFTMAFGGSFVNTKEGGWYSANERKSYKIDNSKEKEMGVIGILDPTGKFTEDHEPKFVEGVFAYYDADEFFGIFREMKENKQI